MTWPRAILLDFYGTVVVQDDAVIASICEQIVRAARVYATPRQVAERWGARYADLCAESHGPRFELQKELGLRSLRETLTHFQAHLDAEELSQELVAYWRRPTMFPESRGVLERCEVPIAIVSDIDNAELLSALNWCDLSFDITVTSEDCRAYKPHPAPFARALEALHLEPQDVLHVGDSLSSDVRGARALGIAALWINRRGRVPSSQEEQPDYTSADLTGILAVGRTHS